MYICEFIYDIKMPKGASEARARDVLIVKKLNKCTLSILMPNLFPDRQHNMSTHRYVMPGLHLTWTPYDNFVYDHFRHRR